MPKSNNSLFTPSRRNFIRQAGILSAATVLAPALASVPSRQKIGLQLYTLRDQIVNHVSETLRLVASAGYTEVETFDYNKKTGFWGYSPKEFSKLLSAAGLRAVSGHYDSDKLLENGNTEVLKDHIDAAKNTGGTYVTIPSIPSVLRKTADDYKRLADRMNTGGKLCASSGIRLAYHNHDFEFRKFGDTTGLEILLSHTDPSLVSFELDLYWAVYSGYDPASLFKTYPKRFHMWHVKDMSKLNRNDNTEIGNGLIDFKPFFHLSKTSGMKHFFVEQETNYNPDPFGAINKSSQYIQSKIL